MTKLKWLSADWGLSIRQLGSALKEWQFTEGSDEGFVVDRLRRDSIEARYVQRETVTEVVVDPFGNETSFSTVKYQEQSFAVVADSPCIEFRGNVRHVHSCLGLLSLATNFKVAVRPMKVDVTQWLNEFVPMVPFPVALDAFQVGSIVFPDGASARALVKAGNGDAQAAMESITTKKPHVVEKVRVKHKQLGGKGAVVLSSSCLAVTSGFSVQEDLLVQDALRLSLTHLDASWNR